jgi:hypothetical protein
VTDSLILMTLYWPYLEGFLARAKCLLEAKADCSFVFWSSPLDAGS